MQQRRGAQRAGADVKECMGEGSRQRRETSGKKAAVQSANTEGVARAMEKIRDQAFPKACTPLHVRQGWLRVARLGTQEPWPCFYSS